MKLRLVVDTNLWIRVLLGGTVTRPILDPGELAASLS